MFKLIIILFLIKLSSALLAFDCDHPNITISKLSLIHNDNCENISNEETEVLEEVEIELIQNKITNDISYYACKIMINYQLTKCNTFKNDRPIGNFNYLMPLSNNECFNILKNKNFSYPNSNWLTIPINNELKGRYTGFLLGETERTCSGDAFYHPIQKRIFTDTAVFVDIEISLDYGSTSFNNKNNLLSFPSGKIVNYFDFHFVDPEMGYVFWKNKEDKCEKTNYVTLYKGHVEKKTVTDSSSGQITSYYSVPDSNKNYQFLIIKGEKTTLCGIKAYTTNAIPIFLIENPGEKIHFPEILNNSKSNIDMDLLISFKIFYANHDIANQINNFVKIFKQENCKTNNNLVRNILISAKNNPKEFSYLYFNKPGLQAIILGDIAVIKKCEMVYVEHLPIDICTQEIPVIYGNMIKYIAPRSLILIDHPEIFPCNELLYIYHFIDNRWFKRDKKSLIPTNEIIENHFQKEIDFKFKPLEFMNKNIYSQDTVENFKLAFQIPFEKSNNIHNFFLPNDNFRFPDEGDFITISNLKNFISEVKETIWNKILNFAESIGNFFSTVVGFYILYRIFRFFIIFLINCAFITSITSNNIYKFCFACFSGINNAFTVNQNTNINQQKKTRKNENQNSLDDQPKRKVKFQQSNSFNNYNDLDVSINEIRVINPPEGRDTVDQQITSPSSLNKKIDILKNQQKEEIIIETTEL